MTRIMVGFATLFALAGCWHEPAQRAPVTTTSVTIPPAAQTTPSTAPEPQRSKVEVSGMSFDVQTDPGTTADGRISDGIYAGILSDPKHGFAAQQIDVTTHDGNVVLSGRVRTESERVTIEERARNTAGVKNVDNRLDVMP
jgi:osmotically-inducible protein OsmY